MITANQVASIIIAQHDGFLTSMKLQKLLYYVQAWHLAITDQPLFPERFQAYVDGPVVPSVWHSRKDPSTRSKEQQDVSTLSLDEMTSNIIHLVVENYGSLSGDELSELAHAELPWREARQGLDGDQPSTNELKEQTMAEYYRTECRLGKQTAVDIAAGGVIATTDSREPIDVWEILSNIPEVETYDPWGGANLFSIPRTSSSQNRTELPC